MVKKKKSFAVDPAFFGGAYISFYIMYNMYQTTWHLSTSLCLSLSLRLSLHPRFVIIVTSSHAIIYYKILY